MAKIGFVGIGQMGRAMCPHLIRNGHDVTVYDISNDAVALLNKLVLKLQILKTSRRICRSNFFNFANRLNCRAGCIWS